MTAVGILNVAAPYNASSVYLILATSELAAPAASISITGLPTGYRIFRVTMGLKNTTAASNATLRLNNDSGANYQQTYLRGNAGAATSGDSAGLTAFAFVCPSATWLLHQFTIRNSSAYYKPVQVTGGYYADFRMIQGDYNSNTEVTRIDIAAGANNFAAGSYVVVEGLQ